MPAGRKPLYDVKSLKIGEKLRLPENIEKFKHQYLRNFHKDTEMKFKLIESRNKLFVERIA
jgi:hypothetical protein